MSVEFYAAIFGAVYYLLRLLKSYSIEKTIEIEERRAIVSANIRLETRVRELETELDKVLLTTTAKLKEYDERCEDFKQQILDLKIKVTVLENNQEIGRRVRKT